MGSLIPVSVNKPTNTTMLSWVHEAMLGHSAWRRDAWEDAEFKDGVHWTQADFQRLLDKGINPITINRIFPILNLVNGNYIRSQKDIIAKGRTKQDHEIAQVMSEAIAYVVDQNGGQALQRDAFDSEISVGYGSIYIGYNQDPRKEKIFIRSIPWHAQWWDIYGSPWMDTNSNRYVFSAEWKDLDDVKMAFPDKAKDIDEQFRSLADGAFAPYMFDIGTEIENYKDFLASGRWVNAERRRVRPVEMWYTLVKPTWFAIMPDGRVHDMDRYPMEEQAPMALAAKELQQVHVKKMHVATFIGNLVLQDVPTPFPHDEFPFAPYVGYLDRFNFPYGIPRQIKEQNMEVNKRRSMGLALLGSRRTITEEGAAEDLNVIHDEANRLDSFIVMHKGKIDAVRIEDMAALAAPQISMMMQSEQEIREIVGATDESLGMKTAAQSGLALEKKQQMSSTMTLSLLENAYKSQKILGEKIMSLIQDSWSEEKVMRVIDRLSGVEKFVEINKRISQEDGSTSVHNDITQSRFDLIVSTSAMTDTMREKNMDLLFSAINKAPSEAVAPLLNVAFEISDIPEKERILSQVREATGMGPVDEDLTSDQRKQKQQEQKQAQEAAAAEDRARAQQAQDLDNQKKQAEATKALNEGQAAMLIAQAQKQKVDQDGFVAGHEMILAAKEAKKPKSAEKKK
jgi:hypothetical protein